MKKLDRKSWAIGILVVLLVGAFVWILVGNYQDAKAEEQYLIYQEGAAYGYEYAIYELVEQAVTCEVVPVMIGNQTINMIAVECLEAE